MKFLVSQVTYFLNRRGMRRNITGLGKYLIFLVSVIFTYTIVFHFIMLYIEDREYSWFSGFYWTLTVMTTLGFGDITFESDIGRIFSVLVLLSGVILLLIMLPFTFIQSFYAPWLEAQLDTRCPRKVPEETQGHVIICQYDTIAPNLIEKLNLEEIPYFVIETDSAKAAEMFHEGISVIQGDVENLATYQKMNVNDARMVFVNCEDTVNSNIILTIREAAAEIPIVAIADNEDSVDILELSGATHVLALKVLLGESLASRISVGESRTNVIRSFDDWQVIEFPVRDTVFAGKTLVESNLRKDFGINIVGIWKRGILQAAKPDSVLTESSIPVGIGTNEQINQLNKLIEKNGNTGTESVLIIGGGKVGRAAGRALKEKDLNVLMIEANKKLRRKIEDIPDRLTIGDAADRYVLEQGGLKESSLVILSTNQDAVNIYLSIYCRRLNPDLLIVSRITHDRNLEAIHRAGANFVLSYAPIGAELVMSILLGREPVILGGRVEFIRLKLPESLSGKTLAECKIGLLTGVTVLGVVTGEETIIKFSPEFRFPKDCDVELLATSDQLKSFEDTFGE
ncbi:MAG: potassium transporter TrkA [Pyrinomonadaceae bacterium]|nr:potassium transporter TrkA [Pyrinomonadaceae bacterium]